MKKILLALLLTACHTASDIGSFDLVQCGSISGCSVIYNLKTKQDCMELASKMKDQVYAYQCVEVKL